MNLHQADFSEAMMAETIQRLEAASACIFHALRESARQQQQARQAGAIEYDSWAAAMESGSLCARLR